MSRFADPTAVRVVSLGACQCPGTPHERDEATLRWQLGASALARIGYAELTRRKGDPLAAFRALVAETLVAWNLVLLEGDVAVPVPISPVAIAELDEATLEALATAADGLLESKGSLPNDSGAPSAASSRESASPTPRTPRKRTT